VRVIMENGWYKIIKRKSDFDNDVAYVENDKIIETKNEWGENKKIVNIDVTDDMRKNMAIMGFHIVTT